MEMATIDTSGFREVERQLLYQSEIASRAVPRMLQAGANVLINAQKAEAQNMGIRRTGDFINSIGIYKEIKTGLSASIIVMAKGNDRKGVRNVEKGFIIHYGLKKGRASSRRRVRRINNRNIVARPWMDKANTASEDEVRQVMRGIWEDMNSDH